MNNIGPLPHFPHDIACPILIGDEGMPREPYVMADRRSRLSPLSLERNELPRRILQLTSSAGGYLHLDPRDVNAKLRELVGRGIVASRDPRVWVYRECATQPPMEEYATAPSIWLLFPNTPDRFYFASSAARVELKRSQISDFKFEGAEWYCPDSLCVTVPYMPETLVEPGMDVYAMLRGAADDPA